MESSWDPTTLTSGWVPHPFLPLGASLADVQKELWQPWLTTLFYLMPSYFVTPRTQTRSRGRSLPPTTPPVRARNCFCFLELKVLSLQNSYHVIHGTSLLMFSHFRASYGALTTLPQTKFFCRDFVPVSLSTDLFLSFFISKSQMTHSPVWTAGDPRSGYMCSESLFCPCFVRYHVWHFQPGQECSFPSSKCPLGAVKWFLSTGHKSVHT